MKKLILSLSLASGLVAQTWPGAVYTPLVAKDNLQTTLAVAMTTGSGVAFVASSTGWVANQVAYICDTTSSTGRCTGTYEAMLVTSVAANALTVTRAYGGTTAYAHAIGKAVINAVTSVYNTALNNEVLALQQYAGLGEVTMRHTSTGTTAVWSVYRPDGTTLSTVGTTTQGLQEAITYAFANGYVLRIHGGGVVYSSTGPVTRAYSRITCTTAIAIPHAWVNSIHAEGVQFLYDVANGATAATDFFTFDSADMYDLDLGGTEIIYPGTGSAVRFLPATNNGESFAGTTSSHIRFGTIAVVDPTTLQPKTATGTGFRVSMPALGLGLTNGNGPFTGSRIDITEINGGAFGGLIDNPGAGNSFSHVIINAYAHGQGTVSWKMGTSAAAAGLIYGNILTLRLAPDAAGDALHTWGGAHFAPTQFGGDAYTVSILNGTNGVVFQTSAAHNHVRVAAISIGTAAYVNLATSMTNVIEDSGPLTLAAVTVSASPFKLQNVRMKPELVAIYGNAVSAIEVSNDDGTYITVGAATNANVQLKPGQWLKVTYGGGAPTMREAY